MGGSLGDNEKRDHEDWTRMRLAVLLAAFMVLVPALSVTVRAGLAHYRGQELSMTGRNQPAESGCMRPLAVKPRGPAGTSGVVPPRLLAPAGIGERPPAALSARSGTPLANGYCVR